MNETQAFPLHWPPGRARTTYRQDAPFHRKEWAGDGGNWKRQVKLTIADSRDRVMKELKMLGASGVVISSNLELKMDGTPRSAQREPTDPGIAVYFQLRQIPHCLSCDKWRKAADNLAAIAKYVEAMRGQIRWGVGDVASMFAGFKALPGAVVTPIAMTSDEAAAFIGKFVDKHPTQIVSSADVFKSAYRAAAMKLHPDRNGGTTTPDWNMLQQAEGV